MKNRKIRLLCVVLCVALLFCGCELLEGTGFMDLLDSVRQEANMIPYADMEYVRPEPEAIEQALEVCMESAMGEDFDKLVEELYAYMDLYHNFYTNYALANIHYCCDMTDIYWTDEYDYCMRYSAEVSAGVDQLMYVLADSVHREALETEEYYGEGYFDGYEGESVWDETFTGLMDAESALLTEYYDLSAQVVESSDTDAVYWRMAELLAELIALRQEIAEYTGYESFRHFAYDFYYARDYTPEQEAVYLAQVRQELTPVYEKLRRGGVPGLRVFESGEKETYAYVQEMAEAMGGTVLEAFKLLDGAELYDITYSDNKYNASFEVFLSGYGEPFVFMNPTGSTQDHLTFAHEFGHFCNDYASYGSVAGIDVMEVFSQGMEYLSLCYCQDTEALTTLKMADSLCVFVEQSAYAEFERRVYLLTGEELTADALTELFRQVAMEYGLGDLGGNSIFFTQIPHFYTNPMYVFSYVVSNDAALQLYQLEKAEAGAGLAAMEANLATEEAYFLAFLESAELESPFAEGRLDSIRATFEEVLG